MVLERKIMEGTPWYVISSIDKVKDQDLLSVSIIHGEPKRKTQTVEIEYHLNKEEAKSIGLDWDGTEAGAARLWQSHYGKKGTINF